MGSSLVKITIHLVFHIKSTSPTILPDDLPILCKYIGGTIRGVDGVPIQIGGYIDHVHILCTLPKTMSVSDFVKTVKSESSRWIKKFSNHYVKFCWQTGYGAFSVSPSALAKTTEYIKNQREHHRIKTFDEEYKSFLNAYGIEYDEQFFLRD